MASFATPAQREFNGYFREKAFQPAADLDTGLARNEMPYRMERKASKKDLVRESFKDR